MSVWLRKRQDPTTGKTKNGTWIVDVDFEFPDGQRRRVRKTAPVQTKKAALEYERKLRQAIQDGTYRKEEEKPAQPLPTIEEFATELLTYARLNNKPSEAETKASILKHHLIPAFGLRRLDQLGVAEIETYKAQKLEAGLSPKTINNHLLVISRMFGLARELEIVDRRLRFKRLPVRQRVIGHLDVQESAQLASAGEGPWRTMIALALQTGLRLGELLALRWQDLDLDLGVLTVAQSVVRGIVGSPKSGRNRHIPLTAGMVDELTAVAHDRGELVFCAKDGRMFTKNEAKWPLRRACDSAGLRRIGWHGLRHTFASRLVIKGAVLKNVQELMGHSSIVTTMRYAHLSPVEHRAAIALLESAP